MRSSKGERRLDCSSEMATLEGAGHAQQREVRQILDPGVLPLSRLRVAGTTPSVKACGASGAFR